MTRKYTIAFVVPLLAASVMLTSCAQVPVNFGGTDEVMFANADTIKIYWDENRTTHDAVKAKAQAHCAGRGVEVTDEWKDPGTLGILRTTTWRCVGQK